MNQAPAGGQRLVWSLWLAAAVVFIGGVLPLVFGGTSSRLSQVVVPFTIGAIGIAACALLRGQSRSTVAIVYFVAGLAIVYGLLSMFTLPVRLTALGSCPVAPYPCPSGLPRAMSDGENTGLGTAAAFGIGGLLVGFFGLFTLYRRPAPTAFTPPVRKIPPIPAPEASSSKEPSSEPELREPELPAHEEPPELPPHESEPATT